MTTPMFVLLFRYLDAPFIPFFVSLLITDEAFSVRAVSRVVGEQGRMLKVDFASKPTTKGQREMHGWLVVSPEQAWVLRSYEFSNSLGTTYAGTIEYGEVQRGVPVPKRVVHTVRPPGGGSNGMRTEYNFDEISLVDDVPDRDFTLAAFGFPEPGSPKPRRTGRPALWLFVFACVAMAAAVALKSAASRLQRKAAPAGG